MMEMTPKLWAKYAWLAHLIGVVFLARRGICGVTSQSMRIDKLEVATHDVPAALARIEQKVDDMHDAYLGRRQ